MSDLNASKLLNAVVGVTPEGLARQYGYEIVAGVCGAAGAGVLLVAAYVEMAAAWGAQPARLIVAALLIAAAVVAHQAATRRRRIAETEAMRARMELQNVLGIAQSFMGRSVTPLAPLAAFAAAFFAARRG